MKRLNPDTGKPYVIGVSRTDGKVFRKYLTKSLGADGFFKETWCSLEQFNKERQLNNISRSARFKQHRLSPKGRAESLLKSAKDRCKGVVTITEDWIESKIISNCCELTGLPFDLNPSESGTINPHAPSLDRKDNDNRDYTPENTRVVLAAVNFAINQFGLETMLPIFRKLAQL